MANPERTYRIPENKKGGIVFTPILIARYVVPQRKHKANNAKYGLRFCKTNYEKVCKSNKRL